MRRNRGRNKRNSSGLQLFPLLTTLSSLEYLLRKHKLKQKNWGELLITILTECFNIIQENQFLNNNLSMSEKLILPAANITTMVYKGGATYVIGRKSKQRQIFLFPKFLSMTVLFGMPPHNFKLRLLEATRLHLFDTHLIISNKKVCKTYTVHTSCRPFIMHEK